MAWQTPKYNRNITSKLEKEDLNRIEENIRILAQIMALDIDCKTDWTIYDFPKLSDFIRICSNIDTLYQCYGIPENAPPLPAAPFLYYSKIDDIEYIINLIYERYSEGISVVIFTGEAYTGNEIGVI